MNVPHRDNAPLEHVDATGALCISGIYQIRNIYNNKVYIGSARNYKTRKTDHFRALRRNKHYNAKLQRAWNKYGENSFVFEILEYVPDINKLIEREQFYIEAKHSVIQGYNLAGIAGSTLGVKYSKKVKKKLSLIHKERYLKMTKKDLSEIYGKSHRGKHHSEETKQKMRVSSKGKNAKRVKCVELDRIFNSFPEAAQFINKTVACICRALKGPQKTAGGFHWEYVDE